MLLFYDDVGSDAAVDSNRVSEEFKDSLSEIRMRSLLKHPSCVIVILPSLIYFYFTCNRVIYLFINTQMFTGQKAFHNSHSVGCQGSCLI